MTSLGDRIQAIEAELAIRNVIARYGLAADSGQIDIALDCHTKDAVYIVSNPDAGREERSGGDLELKGHRAIADMLWSQRHQSLIPHCAHTVGPLVVQITGEDAKVIGYSRVYNRVSDRPNLMRLAFNCWHMHFESGAWKIACRESRIMGDAEAQAMLERELD